MKNYPLIVVAALLLMASSVFAFGQKTKTTNPGAIVLFESCDTAPDVAACEAANRVRNDVAGIPYVNGSDGVSAVFFAGGSNDLVFRLDGSQTRTLLFDFRDAAYTGGAPSWWYTSPQQNIKPQMNVLGAYNAKLQCGGASTCDVNYQTRINAGYWSVPGFSNTTYALLWNPTAASSRPVNSPYSTSPVNVNYVKDANGERFTITPLPSSDCTAGTACETDPIIAGLEVSSKHSVTSGGQYHMPFTMTVTLQ